MFPAFGIFIGARARGTFLVENHVKEAGSWFVGLYFRPERHTLARERKNGPFGGSASHETSYVAAGGASSLHLGKERRLQIFLKRR